MLFTHCGRCHAVRITGTELSTYIPGQHAQDQAKDSACLSSVSLNPCRRRAALTTDKSKDERSDLLAGEDPHAGLRLLVSQIKGDTIADTP